MRVFLLLALLALSAPALAKGMAPRDVRCVDVHDARPERIGVHTLLLKTERLRGKPPTDYRVHTLRLHLLDEVSAKVSTLDVPLERLRAAFSPLLAGGVETKNRKGALLDNFMADAAHLSDDGKTLALRVKGPGAEGASHTAIVFWTVGTGRVVIAKDVHVRPRKSKATMTVLGRDATGALLVLGSERIDAGSGRHVLDLHLQRIEPANASKTTVWKHRTPPRRNDRIAAGTRYAFSADRKRLALPEYLEDPAGEAAVHVVELETGGHRAYPAPATTYGVAFASVGNALFLGSNRLGTVQRLDLATGKVEREAKGFPRLHKLIAASSGDFLFAFLKGGEIKALYGMSMKPMAAASMWDARKLLGGTLYAQIAPSSDSAFQSIGRTADKHGFGTLDRICVVRM